MTGVLRSRMGPFGRNTSDAGDPRIAQRATLRQLLLWEPTMSPTTIGVGIVALLLLITILSFLPVFALTGREGKLFHPLAYTKTFALVGVAFLSITLSFSLRGGLPVSR